MEPKGQNRIEIELTEEVAQGNYSNLAIISHSPSEFVIDFVKVVPGVPKAKVVSRVILSPDRAKALLDALTDNVKKYETNIGKIRTFSGPENIPPINFSGNFEA